MVTRLLNRSAATILLLCVAIMLGLVAGRSYAEASWLDRLRGLLGQEPAAPGLSQGEIADGLREALRVGTDNVVGQLGQAGGFNLDPEIRITLPRQLERARNLLERFGMDDGLVDLEARLNRAAELATPRAGELFREAVADLSLQDAMDIYRGPEDAATQYFRGRMAEPLAAAMRPVVEATLSESGAAQLLDSALERYRDIPLAPRIDVDLTDYVVEKTQDGIFLHLAREEAAIRSDPARRTTELLRRVFGP